MFLPLLCSSAVIGMVESLFGQKPIEPGQEPEQPQTFTFELEHVDYALGVLSAEREKLHYNEDDPTRDPNAILIPVDGGYYVSADRIDDYDSIEHAAALLHQYRDQLAAQSEGGDPDADPIEE